MEKTFKIIMTVFILLAIFLVNVFTVNAEEEGTVLRVSALKKDNTTEVVNNYTVFEEGWNAAMELAINSKEMNENNYARVIVDIYADWNAVDGEFTKDFINGPGFDYDTIYFADDVKMTLDLNGFTIDRGLTSAELNGEVIFINDDANVTINIYILIKI